jgi:aminopeptidase
VPDARVQRLAEVLVDYSTAVRPGDLVIVDTSPPAASLVRALYRKVLEAGGHPYLRIDLDGELETLLKDGSDAQLDWVNPTLFEQAQRADVEIAVEADSNTRRLSGVDPARQARRARAREKLRERYFERAAAGDLRRVVTLYPTSANAQDAEMSLGEYEDFVYGAGFLDRDDPGSAWRSFGEQLERTASWLGEKQELRIVAEDTDLTVGVAGRTWVASDGKENFPDGEVFTGPIETSVEGTIKFTFPAMMRGRQADGVRLRFEGGEVVEATADRGQEFLREMIAMDDGARRVGEFAFGLNEGVTEFTGHTLFDEKIGGTCHLALGRSYPETGGVNLSALHWDLVCDLRAGGEVYADGELVYRDGRFLDGAP